MTDLCIIKTSLDTHNLSQSFDNITTTPVQAILVELNIIKLYHLVIYQLKTTIKATPGLFNIGLEQGNNSFYMPRLIR